MAYAHGLVRIVFLYALIVSYTSTLMFSFLTLIVSVPFFFLVPEVLRAFTEPLLNDFNWN